MMAVNIEALIIVVAYLVGMLIIGFVVGKLKIKDADDYMLAGRRMGLFMIAFSSARTISEAEAQRDLQERHTRAGG